LESDVGGGALSIWEMDQHFEPHPDPILKDEYTAPSTAPQGNMDAGASSSASSETIEFNDPGGKDTGVFPPGTHSENDLRITKNNEINNVADPFIVGKSRVDQDTNEPVFASPKEPMIRFELPPPVVKPPKPPEIQEVHSSDPGSSLSGMIPLQRSNSPSPDVIRVLSSEVVDEPATQTSDNSKAYCADDTFGYEALVGPCTRIRYPSHGLLIPMVLNSHGKCKGQKCNARDASRCCARRRQCMSQYANDVKGGCGKGKTINQFIFAYCKNSPCTTEDERICCLKSQVVYDRINNEKYRIVKSLYRRIDYSPSRRPRTDPVTGSGFVSPPIQFQTGDIAWFDWSRKFTDRVDGTEWVPLVNFMEEWGDGYGWKTDAWMKFSKHDVPKYEQLQIGEKQPLDRSVQQILI